MTHIGSRCPGTAGICPQSRRPPSWTIPTKKAHGPTSLQHSRDGEEWGEKAENCEIVGRKDALVISAFSWTSSLSVLQMLSGTEREREE